MQRVSLAGSLLSILVVLLVGSVVGCTAPPTSAQRLEDARSAYAAGDYAAAYRRAQMASGSNTPAVRHEAAYIAGMSAYRQRDLLNAERFLKLAAESRDAGIAGPAMAQLGLMYADLGWDSQAMRHLLAAAEHLQGQDRANAYYHAARAQQRLGQFAQARTNLTLAANQSTDDALRARAAEQLDVTGYTLQLGAFANQVNAQREADRRAATIREAGISSPRISLRSETGRTLHVVQAGRFTSYLSAQQARQRLNFEAIVVPLRGE